MCVVHMVSYPGCRHIHSYAEIVHDNAIYCSNQEVIDDGTSKEQWKCPDCLKKDQELLSENTVQLGLAEVAKAHADCRRGAGRPPVDGLKNNSSSETRSEAATELEFIDNYFGHGAETGTETGTKTESRDLGSSYGSGSGFADSRMEWEVVQEADGKGHEIAGLEDEVVVFRRGKELHEVLAVDVASELISAGQLLPRAVERGEEELSVKETGRGRAREQEQEQGPSRPAENQPRTLRIRGRDRTAGAEEAGAVKQDTKSSMEVEGGEARRRKGKKGSGSRTGR
jgi:hypothetical protein